MFEYPLDLHCSQTLSVSLYSIVGLNTLWIYTALKHNMSEDEANEV